MKDKYVWWGLLGLGVAFLLWYLTSKQIAGQQSSPIQIPYLVPTTGASPSADTSLSNQPNIIGSSSNSQVPNFSNPYGVATSFAEAPNTWGFMPNLNVTPPSGVNNGIGFGAFNSGFGFSSPASPLVPFNTLSVPQTGNPMVLQ